MIFAASNEEGKNNVIEIAGMVCLGVIASACLQSAWLYVTGDKTGLSGRFGKEQDNRRIDGPDDRVRNG